MRHAILFLLLSTLPGYSQEIKYNLILKDQCTNSFEKSFSYHLEQNGIVYNITDFDNGTISLPAKGEYTLIATDLKVHNITVDSLINFDTLVLPKMVERIIWPPYSFNKEVNKKIRQKNLPTFWICDEKCNGNLTDYYSNGNLRISGTFVNGLPVGELKRYYQNGKIREISNYDTDGFRTKQILFAEDGQIIKE